MTGPAEAVELLPNIVIFAPTITPKAAVKLYSTAGNPAVEKPELRSVGYPVTLGFCRSASRDSLGYTEQSSFQTFRCRKQFRGRLAGDHIGPWAGFLAH